MDFAVDQVIVDLSPEDRFDLRYGPVEGDLIAAVGDRGHCEALGFQPSFDTINVVLSHSEAVGELRRREPFVIVRGGAVLLLGQQVVEILLLSGGGPESQRHPMEQFAAVSAAKIKTRLSKTMHAALERYHLAGVNRPGDAVGLRGEAQG